MYFYTYEIMIDDPNSSLNGCFYYGKHETCNLDDGYLGSGKIISRYIKKHGKQYATKHLKKKILKFYTNRQELNLAEQELIESKRFDKSIKCLNLHEGGTGGHWVEYISKEEYDRRCKLVSVGVNRSHDKEWLHMNSLRAGNAKKNATKEQRQKWSNSYKEMHKNMSKEDKEKRYTKVATSLKEFYADPENENTVRLMKENNKLKNQETAKIWRSGFKQLFGYSPEYFRKYGLMQRSLTLYKQIRLLPIEEQHEAISEFFKELENHSTHDWRYDFKQLFGYSPEYFRKYGLQKVACDLWKSIKELPKEEAKNEVNRFMESITKGK